MTVVSENTESQTVAAVPAKMAPRPRKPLGTRAYKVFRVGLVAVVLPDRAAVLDDRRIVQDQRGHLRHRQGVRVHPHARELRQRAPAENYFVFIFNSLWVAFVSTALSLVLGVPAAYAMSRFTMHRRPSWS